LTKGDVRDGSAVRGGLGGIEHAVCAEREVRELFTVPGVLADTEKVKSP